MNKLMQNRFAQNPEVAIPRASFKRDSYLKTTFDADYLVPIYVDEYLPGDTFNMSAKAFIRLATPIFPIMDNLYIDIFWFSCDYRILWTNWKKFMGEQVDPGDSIDYTLPVVSGGTSANITTSDEIFEKMGIPYVTSLDWNDVQSLPFRAYNKIWNEWFRSQDLQDSLTEVTGDGPDTASVYTLQKRNKRHDYFTSCLPNPQKGNAVSLPLGTQAEVLGIGVPSATTWSSQTIKYGLQNSETANYSDSSVRAKEFSTPLDSVNIYADLSNATAASINELREAFQVQKLLERDSRSGTRYTEVIRGHFGVQSPDGRQQRPELLGMSSQPVNMTAVPQTSSTDVTSPQGNLAAYATAFEGNSGFVKSFTEHGVIIGLANLRSEVGYQNGLDRMWSRQTRYDFYWPSLSQIGEQPIYNREIFYQNTSADDAVFGYNERYSEYRYKPSRVSGLFNSNHASSLDSWHLCQDFAALPTLNSDFIEANTPLDRCIAVPTEPHVIADFYFDLTCARPMPLYGIPGMIDHF